MPNPLRRPPGTGVVAPTPPPKPRTLPGILVRGAFDATAGTPVELAWPEAFDDFAPVGPTKDEKHAAPAWLPVTLVPGGRRKDEFVAAVHALVLDYDVDDRGIPAEDILARWAGYERVLHSTWTPGRWRVILPYARPLTAAEHARMYAWAIQREGDLIDPVCRNPSRIFFLPCFRSDLDVEPVYGYEAGELLSVEAAPEPSDLRQGRAVAPPPGSSPPFVNQTPLPSSHGDTRTGGEGGAVPGAYAAVADAGQDRDLGLIESRCAFMAHARDDAEALPEPEWYAALSVWARCKNGDALAHERSRPYPGYSQAETALKLARAKAVGPATCAYVRSISPACRACPLQVTSPVLLGRVEPEPVDPASPAAVQDAHAELRAAEERLEQAGAEKRKALLEREKAARRYRVLRSSGMGASEEELEQALLAKSAAEDAAAIAERVWKAREKEVGKLRSRLSVAGLPPGADPVVWQKLRLGQDGRPVDSVANVLRVLSDDPGWQRRLSYDTFALDVLLDGKALPEAEAPRIAQALADGYALETTTPRTIECVGTAARACLVHPVQDYLNGLKWDGTPRAGLLCFEGFGVKGVVQPWQEELVEAIGRKFLLSMVARALRPGCKMDTMLVLTGPQGAFKSTALERLVPNPGWFARTKLDLANKDSFLSLRGKWLFEMAELSSMKKVEANISKGWLSGETDTYRAPYARRAEDHPRQVVVPGTDNEGEFLMDATGHRRYWPVPVQTCSPDWVAEHRDQLFAEAVALFHAGETWWFDERTEVAARLRQWSAPYVVTHPWTDTVSAWMRATAGNDRLERFSATDVLVRALGKEAGDLTSVDQHTVGNILRQLGCPRVARDTQSGLVTTLFTRPEWAMGKTGESDRSDKSDNKVIDITRAHG